MVSLSGKSLDFYVPSGDLKILPSISSGGFGDVVSSGNFAIKTYRGGLDYSTIREISILKFLQPSKFIIPFVDVLFSDDLREISLVMDKAPQDLKTIIHNHTYQYDVNDYFRQLSCGLAYMHSHNILHRDIKPNNILVFPGNQLKYTDFGLSRTVACSDEIGRNLTEPVFTLWYRSPEVLLGQQYSDLADVWALGCVFYELIFRKVMFLGIPTQSKSELNVQMPVILQKLGQPREMSDDKRLSWPSRRNNIRWNPSFDSITCEKDVFIPSPTNMTWFIGQMLAYDPKNRMTSYDLVHRLHPERLANPFQPCWSRNSDKTVRFAEIERYEAKYWGALRTLSSLLYKDNYTLRFNAAYYFNQTFHRLSKTNQFDRDEYELYAEAAASVSKKFAGATIDPKSEDLEKLEYQVNVVNALKFDLVVVSPITIINSIRTQLDEDVHSSISKDIDKLWSSSMPGKQLLARYDAHVIVQGFLQLHNVDGKITNNEEEVAKFLAELK